MKCIECGMEIGEMPEDAMYEEMLCNLCYKYWEEVDKDESKSNS